MSKSLFIGRKLELELLHALQKQSATGLIVVKGRRRIGKSRLITEFAAKYKGNKFWNFVGLSPHDGITAQDQRDHFAKQLAAITKIPLLNFSDWSDALAYLALHLKAGDIILFDEISWMGSKDPGFIPKLKAWWDEQTLPILLFFCGSVSTWIEDNILKNTAFFERINLTLTLEPLSIQESAMFLQHKNINYSYYDIYKVLSILGGIPGYLEKLNPAITADENIKLLAFEKNGLLVLEFDRIFNELFNGSGSTYKKILETLKTGAKTLLEVRKALNFADSGPLSTMMEHLITAGFIEKQPLWSFKTLKPLKQSLYRISDPFISFYLQLIAPNLDKISLDELINVPLSTIPGIEAHLELQLEYLLLQNRSLLLKSIGINAIDILRHGPYRQHATKSDPSCQIDYLIQTVTKNLFICEFKFSRRELGIDIISDMQHKIKALKVPRGFAVVPVLFHLSGVSAALATAEYFYRIIDLADFLEIS